MKPLGSRLLLLLVASAVVSLVISSPADEDDLDLDREIEDDDDDHDSEADNNDESQIESPDKVRSPTTPAPSRPQLGVPGCGAAPARKRLQPRIVNGYNASYGEFPSYVRLRYGNGTHTSNCGGTLISDRHVLTAMHCVENLLEGHTLDLIFGDLLRFHKDSHEVTIGASHVKCTSPYYFSSNGEEHDWVLVELKHPVKMNDYIQPACLPRRKYAFRVRGEQSRCYLVGMGVKEFHRYENSQNGAGILADRLEKLRVEQSNCPREFKIFNSDPSRVCFRRADGQVGGNTCMGDSGGPVLCEDFDGKWTLAAIVNGGRYRDCGVYEDLVHYTIKTIFADVIKLTAEMDQYCVNVLVSTVAPTLPKKLANGTSRKPRVELRLSYM